MSATGWMTWGGSVVERDNAKETWLVSAVHLRTGVAQSS
jgi:hypothetical protein